MSKPTELPAEADDAVCGETFDHKQRVTFEDDDVKQWECESCGAEWFEDKESGRA